jgi:hypothetical protein
MSGEINANNNPESIERKQERRIVSFDNYTDICNRNNDGSRRLGILSEYSYQEIIEDPNTRYINFDGFQVPALINIGHGSAMGYDVKKCTEYAKNLSDDVFFLAVPVHELNNDEKNQLASLLLNKKCALYFSDHNNDESNVLAEVMTHFDIKYTEKQLIDSRAAEGDEQASLCLYSCFAEQTEDRGERKKLRLRDVVKRYKEYSEEQRKKISKSDRGVETILVMGDEISPEQFDEIWDLYNNRFDYLGEGHPISMQDSKEDFLRLLTSENTLFAASYDSEENKQQKLVCFTYFIDNMDELYWLNGDYLEKQFTNSSGGEKYITNIFTPGLVSSGRGNNFALLPIGLFAKVADEAGLSTCVLYENTNLSKKYVPSIVDNTMSDSCIYTTLKPSEMIDEVMYRLWSISD